MLGDALDLVTLLRSTTVFDWETNMSPASNDTIIEACHQLINAVVTT